MQEYYLQDDGIRLHLKLEKPEGMEKGPLMILIHGFTGHMEERHILAVRDTALACGYAVLRADLYGHGHSEGEFRNHNLYKWLNNIMAITDHAKSLDFVTGLYLMGHSQGGLATILAAGMRPDDYKAIIPLAPAIVIEYGAKHGNVLGALFDPEHVPDEVSRGPLVLSGNYVRVAQTLHTDEAIEKYHGPVCIIHGDADEAVPVQFSLDAAKKYEQCELSIIPGDSHCYDLHLDQVQEALEKFLKKVKE